jgi:hypothetical protein
MNTTERKGRFPRFAPPDAFAAGYHLRRGHVSTAVERGKSSTVSGLTEEHVGGRALEGTWELGAPHRGTAGTH